MPKIERVVQEETWKEEMLSRIEIIHEGIGVLKSDEVKGEQERKEALFVLKSQLEEAYQALKAVQDSEQEVGNMEETLLAIDKELRVLSGERLSDEQFELIRSVRKNVYKKIEVTNKKTTLAEKELCVKNTIPEQLEKLENIINGLAPKLKENLTIDLIKIKEDFEKNKKKLEANTPTRGKVRKEKEKVPHKEKEATEPVQMRSDEVAMLFAEKYSVLNNDSLTLADVLTAEKKVGEALAAVQTNKITDNFSGDQIAESEKERLEAKISDYLSEILKREHALYENDLALIREQVAAIKTNVAANIAPLLILGYIKSIKSYLSQGRVEQSQSVLDELKQAEVLVKPLAETVSNKKQWRKDVENRVHRIMELDALDSEHLTREISKDPAKVTEKINDQMQEASELIALFSNKEVQFDIQFKDDSSKESPDDRRNHLITFLRTYKQKLVDISEQALLKKENIPYFKDADTFSKIKEILEKLPDTIGGKEKTDILSALQGVEELSEETYLEKAGKNESFDQDVAILALPLSYGLREAVLRICNEKKNKYSSLLQEEAEERLSEEKKSFEKNRKILTQGKIENPSFVSIDQAIKEPGFASFLNLLDQYYEDDRGVEAVQHEDTEYIKEQYENYVAAREVAEYLKNTLENDVERDFGGRITQIKDILSNIDAYILDTVVKNSAVLMEIHTLVQQVKETPKRIAVLEKDIAGAYAMFNSEEGLSVAEDDVMKREEKLRKIKSESGLNRQELAEYYINSGLVAETTLLERIKGSNQTVLNKGLNNSRFLEQSAAYNYNRLSEYTSRIIEADNEDGLDFVMGLVNKRQINNPRISPPALEAEDMDLITAATNKEERVEIIEKIKAKWIKMQSRYANLVRETELALEEQDPNMFKNSKTVQLLQEEGVVHKDVGIFKETIFATQTIKEATKKLEVQIKEDKEKIKTIRDHIQNLDAQKEELRRAYGTAARRLFHGISAVGEARINIQKHIKDVLFEEDQVDIDAEVKREVAKLRIGKQESVEAFTFRKEAFATEKRHELIDAQIKKSEGKLGFAKRINVLQNKEPNYATNSVEDTDTAVSMRYLEENELQSVTEKAQAEIQKAIELKLDLIFTEVNKDTITEVEKLITKWVHRPPEIKMQRPSGIKGAKSNVVVTKAHEDAVRGKESLQYILQALKSKLDKSNKKLDGAKRILLASIIRKLEAQYK